MINVLVVLNMNAGRRQAVKIKKKIKKFLFRRCKRSLFIRVEELRNIDIEFFDTVIAVGGDGTINKIVPYIINTDINLAIIPVGTANLLAARLGISENLGKSLKIIKAEKIKKIDVMAVNSALSVLRCGFGYDFDVISKTPQSIKHRFGYFSYFVAGGIFSLRLLKKTYDFVYRGKNISIDASCVIFANAGNMFHNLFSIAKNSELDDGRFEIFILKTTNPLLFYYEILRIFLGIRKNSKRAIYLQVDEMMLKNEWCSCHIDGEKVRLQNDVLINIIPSALRVIAK